MSDLRTRLLRLQDAGQLTLALPGQGRTAERHRALAAFGKQDLSLARLVEAHTDAMAILAESAAAAADARARASAPSATADSASALYGVWASDGPGSRLNATLLANGGWRLDGTKPYCSGSSIVDAALVTAYHDGHRLLFDVPLTATGISLCAPTWASTAFQDTATASVSFERVELDAAACLGGPDWYLSRPGFWHGAIGPAACWAGGADYLIEAATHLNRKDGHSRAQVGALQAIGWGLAAVLQQAGDEIDSDPGGRRSDGRVRALKVRHLIERWCTQALDHFGRASGPQLLAFDAVVARQYTALTLYIRQCHAERDLETIPA